MKLGLGRYVTISIIAFWAVLAVLGFVLLNGGTSSPCGLTARAPTERETETQSGRLNLDRLRAEVIQSDLVIRGQVRASEQHYEATGDQRYQDACVYVAEILRGEGAPDRKELLVRWPADPAGEGEPLPPPEMLEDEEYLLLLTLVPAHGPLASQVDFYTRTGGALVVSELDDAELEDVERIVAEAPNLRGGLSQLLRDNGIPIRYFYVHEAILQTVPDVPASLVDLSTGGGAVLFDSRRIQEAAAGSGFDLAFSTGKTLSLILMPLSDVWEARDSRLQALVDGDEIVGAWLHTHGDYWSLKDWAEVRTAIGEEERGMYRPPRNRAGETINLAEWFGVEEVETIEAKSPRARDALLTAESVQLVKGSLNRAVPAESLPGDWMELIQRCGDVLMEFLRGDGYSYYLVYRIPDNRLYSRDDGFSVKAPAEIAQALGAQLAEELECD